MNVKDNLEKELTSLIKKEGLDNSDIYYGNYSNFEEIPLVSRFNHISFLSSFSFNAKNKILIMKGIELIRDAMKNSYKHLNEFELQEYFICLTISDWEDYKEINCLSVNLFVSKRKNWILSQLKLEEKYSIEEYLISEYLHSLDLTDFNTFVPSNHNEEYKRVYIVNNSDFTLR